MSKTESTDVVVLDDAAVESILLGDQVELAVVEDAEDAQRQIVQRILSAESADEVLAAQETTPARELIDQPLQLEAVRWIRSNLPDQQGIGVFALVAAIHGATGDRHLITTGALQIMAQLLKLNQLGAFPVNAVIRQKDQPTAAGFRPMWLEQLPTAG